MTASKSLIFKEGMSGFLSAWTSDTSLTHITKLHYKDAFHNGRRNNFDLELKLELTMKESSELLSKGYTSASILGSVHSPLLGGKCKIEQGTLDLFIPSMDENVKREMLYTIQCHSPKFGPITLFGSKFMGTGSVLSLWEETTTLLISIHNGFHDQKPHHDIPISLGQAHVFMKDLLSHILGMKCDSGNTSDSIKNSGVFLGGFAKSCYNTYLNSKPEVPEEPSLAEPVGSLGNYHQTIIIGSGYGGAISASRFAQKGYDVAILERGKEFKSGDFPDSSRSALANLQMGSQKEYRNRLGLLDIRTYKDAAVVVGCGLGGTSLINANVVAEPSKNIFQNEAWPEEIKGSHEEIKGHYDRVSQILGAKPFPKDQTSTIKKRMEFHRYAKKHNISLKDPPLAVNFEEKGINKFGAYQSPCISCGNCCSGCNIGAKNSLDKNYLPLAKGRGAKIYTQIEVSHFVKLESGDFGVFYWLNESKITGKRPSSSLRTVRCKNLVIAAGALGSPEIMLRSQEMSSLKFSPRLGKGFSLNGGTLGWIYNTDESMNPVGFDKSAKPEKRAQQNTRNVDRPKVDRRKKSTIGKFSAIYKRQSFLPQVGPTITSLLDYRKDENGKTTGFVIEDASIPGVLAPLLPWSIMISSFKFGKNPGDLKVKSLAPILNSLVKGSYHGAINNSIALLGVGYDEQQGEVSLASSSCDEDTLSAKIELSWPSLKFSSWYEDINKEFHKFQKDLGGIFVDYKGLGLNRPISVHPLGSCAMGSSFESSVVNHKCQVFSEDGSVHENLYICDGSIMPCSVGTNPLLLISALTERSMSFIPKASKGEESHKSDPNWPENYMQFSKSNKIQSLLSNTGSWLNSHLQKPINFQNHTEITFGRAVIRDHSSSTAPQLRTMEITKGQKRKEAFVLILDNNICLEEFKQGPYTAMIQSILKLNYNIIAIETRMSAKQNRTDTRHSFDHIASYDIPQALEAYRNHYSELLVMPLGFANLPFFLGQLSGVFDDSQFRAIISVGCSLIPEVSEPWLALTKAALRFGAIPRIQGNAMPSPYLKQLRKCIDKGIVSRYHDRSRDKFSHLSSDPKANIGSIKTPIMFLTGDEDRFFKESQRHSYALFHKLSRTPSLFTSISGYNYNDLLCSETWDKDVAPELLKFFENMDKSLKRSKAS